MVLQDVHDIAAYKNLTIQLTSPDIWQQHERQLWHLL